MDMNYKMGVKTVGVFQYEMQAYMHITVYIRIVWGGCVVRKIVMRLHHLRWTMGRPVNCSGHDSYDERNSIMTQST